jgi:pimeloyl-ACP methyl ester carboxylesterase
VWAVAASSSIAIPFPFDILSAPFAEVDKVQDPDRVREVRLHHVRRGSGEPLVLVHGIGDSVRFWSPVMGRLAREFDVVAVDLPGFGRSASLPSGPLTPATLARAVEGFIGGEPFHVAGVSLGGAVALELGLSGAARSVCAISPIGFTRAWDAAWLRHSLRLTGIAAAAIPRPALASALVRRLVTLQSMRRPMPRAELTATFDDLAFAPAWSQAVDPVADYRFAGVPDCPVTIAWGDRDFLLPHWQAHRARARLPRATHVTLHGCGHLPTWDDPEQVLAAVRGSARRSPQPRGPAAA